MARLIIKTEGFGNRVIELSLGTNRVGRDDDYEICISHETISTLHCELTLSGDGVYVHDCNSTNGTFINGEPVLETWLDPGQTLNLGEVELLVESTEVNIAIPKIERELPKPPAVLPDGEMSCPRHPEHHATFKCLHCHEVMCSGCVRMMRIKGGKPIFLCCICHQKCERINGDKVRARKSFLGRLQETVWLKLGHNKPKK